jgi:ribosomal protein S13
VGISFGSVVTVLRDILGVRRLVAKFVPKELNFQQLTTRKEMSEQNLQAVAEDPELLQRVITGDESWIYGYDIETKTQSSQWCFKEDSRPKKFKRSRSNMKSLLTVFFDCKGIVHHEFLPYGSTVTKEYYREVLRRLRESVRRKRPEM